MSVDLDRKQKMYGIPGAGIETAFKKFLKTDLVANIFYFDHKLECKYPIVAVYDDADKMIVPDEVIPIDENRCMVDLTSFTGAWVSGYAFKVRAIGG